MIYHNDLPDSVDQYLLRLDALRAQHREWVVVECEDCQEPLEMRAWDVAEAVDQQRTCRCTACADEHYLLHEEW